MSEKSTFTKVTSFLSKPEIFFYTTIWLIVILVAGTVDQKFIGLYLAQKKYFSSWILWGFFPGGRLTMLVVFINLAAKLMFASPMIPKRIGTLITHFGMLLLLIGSFFTAYFSTEGNMPIPEGGASSAYQSHYDLEIAVIDQSDSEFDEVTAFSSEYIDTGAIVEHAGFPFTITVKTFFRNVDLVRKESVAGSDFKGAAQRFDMLPKESELEFEQNMAGMLLEFKGLDGDADGTYLVFQFMTVPQIVTAGGKQYEVQLRNKRYLLPFAIELIDFETIYYPGTTMAESYSSLVNIVEGGVSREVKISMNQPLRSGNYTLYQASFIPGDVNETSVLAVVRNAGRQFPYYSSIIMCIGLMIHLAIQVPNLLKRNKRGGKA